MLAIFITIILRCAFNVYWLASLEVKSSDVGAHLIFTLVRFGIPKLLELRTLLHKNIGEGTNSIFGFQGYSV